MSSSFPHARLAGLATIAVLVGSPALAVTSVYTSQAGFLAATQPGSYTETFTRTPDAALAYSFSGSGFGYTVTAAPLTSFGDDVYLSGSFIGNLYSNRSLIVTFTAGNPTAVGGNFSITNVDDQFVPNSVVTVTLSDGTVDSFVPVDADGYRGYVSSVPIVSLTMSAAGASRYNSIDNLTVGLGVMPIPEPASYALMAGGLAALLVLARRRRR